MVRKKSVQKTKNFISKTLKTLTNIINGGYEKIPIRTLVTLNPLSSCSQRSHRVDHMFTNQTTPDHDHDHELPNCVDDHGAKKMNIDGVNCYPPYKSTAKKQATGESKVDPTAPYCSSTSSVIRSNFKLEQKMKELEMMDLGDVDQSLDVEEALHYYSKLTSPVYVEIVNKFFMDMYAEYLLPKPPISTTSVSSSSRRLAPLVLF